MWSLQEQGRTFRKLKLSLIASVLLLAGGIVYGFTTATVDPAIAGAARESLGEFAGLFLGLSKPYLALAIFLNNSVKTLLAIVFGALGGIVPLVFLLVNGYVIGLLLHSAMQAEGITATVVAIAPHGLFELPAILLGTGIGLMLGFHALKRLFGKEERSLTAELARGLRFFLIVILPLLILSAFIEAFITTWALSK